MAAPLSREQLIISVVASFLNSKAIDLKRISSQRRTHNFGEGDFVIPKGCLQQVDNSVLCGLKDAVHERLLSAGVPTARVETVLGVAVYLDRSLYYMEVISKTLKEGAGYGHPKLQSNEAVLLCNYNLLNRDLHKDSDVGLSYLRSVVLEEHCSKLLQCHGYAVQSCICGSDSEKVTDVFSQFGIDTSEHVPIAEPRSDVHLLVTSQFVTNPSQTVDSRHANTEATSCQTSTTSCDKGSSGNQATAEEIQEFDLKKYICEKRLTIGKNNFDKNLSACTVFVGGNGTEIAETAARINHCLKEKNITYCIHISDQSCEFSTQKLNVVLQELSELTKRKLHQKHFVYGSVTKRQENEGTDISTADDLFRLRYAQLRQAAIMKYGEGVHDVWCIRELKHIRYIKIYSSDWSQINTLCKNMFYCEVAVARHTPRLILSIQKKRVGEGWAATLEALTSACIKFELLSCVHRNTLKLNLSDNDFEGSSTSEGSFVMYNCARLATLFRHFQQAVDIETYPPLPPIEQVDFSALREEAEWSLLFNYVDTFPDLIESAVAAIDSKDTIHVQVHTHKICQMLHSLSRNLSSYYSRFHVLGERRSQLLPTMYARLYLLKAVHQVMINGLSLMGIQPLSQL